MSQQQQQGPSSRHVNHHTVQTADDDAIVRCKKQLAAQGSSVHCLETTDGYEFHCTPSKDTDVREVLACFPSTVVFAAKRPVIMYCRKNAVRQRSVSQVLVGVLSIIAAVYLTFV